MFIKLRSAQLVETALWVNSQEIIAMRRRDVDDKESLILRVEEPATTLFFRHGVGGHDVWETPEEIIKMVEGRL
jgi:hypothetical protein